MRRRRRKVNDGIGGVGALESPIATNDAEKQPEAKTILRAAYDAVHLPAEIEVYPGAMHGWCVIDSPVYNAPETERAWSRLLALFGKALGRYWVGSVASYCAIRRRRWVSQ